MITKDNRAAYWKDNLRLVTICLVIWFVVSYLFGIVLATMMLPEKESYHMQKKKMLGQLAEHGALLTSDESEDPPAAPGPAAPLRRRRVG